MTCGQNLDVKELRSQHPGTQVPKWDECDLGSTVAASLMIARLEW
jgi:hypothetical protein